MEYIRRATPEDEVARLEGYKEVLMMQLQSTLERADRLARQIDEVDQAIGEESSIVDSFDDERFVRGTE